MKNRNRLTQAAAKGWGYLKDHRFSKILLKYFLLLFVCLVLPVNIMNIWYGKQQRTRIYEELVKRNEDALDQSYNSVHSILLSAKNLTYSLSVNSGIQYLASRTRISTDTTGDLDSVISMVSVIRNANSYMDSIYIYFANASEVVTEAGVSSFGNFRDREALEAFSREMPKRNQLKPHQKNGKYPYLLTITYPISAGKGSSVGMIAVNLDVEKLGDYIGSGVYRKSESAPRLLIFDQQMESLIYSDEYRLFQEAEDLEKLKELCSPDGSFTEVGTILGENYVVSGKDAEDGFRCFYLSSIADFEAQNRAEDLRIREIMGITVLICLMLASLLAVWVYRPIKRTIRVLSDVSMLTDWDRKEHMDEIEAIQRSILLAKKEKDDLNAQIQERMISLHNAQICALQTQINPHFLFNTLEAIANASALLMNGDNPVTDMIYTLGQLMRISLSNETYLVPLSEELEHVKLYVKLVEFRFHGRVSLQQEIPDELGKERIVKLTLQPLIENAVQHGLAHKRSGGKIWLRGEKKGKETYLYVIDNGEGVDEEELAQLQERLHDSAVIQSRHIGMRNVDQRLKLVFGEDCGLSLSHSEEGGLCVTVHFRETDVMKRS